MIHEYRKTLKNYAIGLLWLLGLLWPLLGIHPDGTLSFDRTFTTWLYIAAGSFLCLLIYILNKSGLLRPVGNALSAPREKASRLIGAVPVWVWIGVSDIMTRKIITLAPDTTVEEAAEVLLKQKISGAPVVDDAGRLLGVITKSDLFRMLIALTGLPNRGIQFALKVKNRPDVIPELMAIFGEYEGQLVNVLISHKPTTDQKFVKVYFRILGLDRSRLDALKEDLREKATLLYLVDYFENRREIYDAEGN